VRILRCWLCVQLGHLKEQLGIHRVRAVAEDHGDVGLYIRKTPRVEADIGSMSCSCAAGPPGVSARGGDPAWGGREHAEMPATWVNSQSALPTPFRSRLASGKRCSRRLQEVGRSDCEVLSNPTIAHCQPSGGRCNPQRSSDMHPSPGLARHWPPCSSGSAAPCWRLPRCWLAHFPCSGNLPRGGGARWCGVPDGGPDYLAQLSSGSELDLAMAVVGTVDVFVHGGLEISGLI
jgi:hypothetical protein